MVENTTITKPGRKGDVEVVVEPETPDLEGARGNGVTRDNGSDEIWQRHTMVVDCVVRWSHEAGGSVFFGEGCEGVEHVAKGEGARLWNVHMDGMDGGGTTINTAPGFSSGDIRTLQALRSSGPWFLL
nr:hypothetical protein Iba_chr06aCG15140 [Ipomoea batatas]